MDKSVVIVVLLWNLVVFLMYGFDKNMAIQKQRRVSEKTLLLSAFAMGGVGAFFGMKFFHHKTKHLSFNILVPLSIVFNAGIIYLLSEGIVL
ncbi:MAG: DUF1294 domain-containing protein [Filifactoraceae bacterium]